jgi:hypothetical protein
VQPALPTICSSHNVLHLIRVHMHSCWRCDQNLLFETYAGLGTRNKNWKIQDKKNCILWSKDLPSKQSGTTLKNAGFGMKDDTRATWEWMQTKASGTGHDIAADTA